MTTIRLPMQAGYILLRRPRVRDSAAPLLALLRHLAGWPGRVAESRRTMRLLAAMNDHELADIGLTRQDLRDASSVAPGDDPTMLLSLRVRERMRRAP